MLKTEEMSKVLVVGPDTYLKKVIDTLYDEGVLHIKQHESTEGLDIGSPLDDAGAYSECIVGLRSIASYLNVELKKEPAKKSFSVKEIQEAIAEINERLKSINGRMASAVAGIKQREQAISEIAPLVKVNLPFDSFADYKSLSYFAGILTKQKGFAEEINKITSKYGLFQKTEENKMFFALFVENSFAKEVLALLQRHGFVATDVSRVKGLKGTPAEFADKAAREIESLKREKAGIEAELADIKMKKSGFVADAEAFLSAELEKAEAPLRFAKTRSSFLVTGWVPTANYEKLSGKLRDATKNSIYIMNMHMEHEENVPVKLRNPKAVKPFEFFMNLYSLPSYHEMDPTFFIFISFPIFFGFMLGDIGYGIVTLVLFWLLKKKMPKLGGFFNILILASVSSIIFGVIFGEFFGYEKVFEVELWRAISRNPEHDIMPLMIAAIFWGVIHVNLGLVLGFVNELSHGLKKAILAKGGWFVLEASVIIFGITFLMKIDFLLQKVLWLSFGVWLGIAVFLSSAVMLFLGEGPRGLVEIPGLFGNIASYMRLMAIGLSSVGLAIVINNLAGAFFKPFGILSIFGVLILIIGHVLNIGIGLLGGFLHSMRLHYVEFFTKFYKGGGIPYLPFGKIKSEVEL